SSSSSPSNPDRPPRGGRHSARPALFLPGVKMTTELRVAMIGHGFMGAAHSVGWRQAPAAFDLPLAPRMAVLVGRDAAKTAAAAAQWGWDETATDWRAVIERD